MRSGVKSLDVPFEGLAHTTVHKYLWAVGPALDREDLLQEARLAAWLYKENPRGWQCSNTSAVGYAINAAAHAAVFSLSRAVRITDGIMGTAALRAGKGRRADPVILDRIRVAGPERSMVSRRIRAAWDALEERERAILRAVFVEDKSLADIGREMGLSRERVRQLEARALQKLRPAGGE